MRQIGLAALAVALCLVMGACAGSGAEQPALEQAAPEQASEPAAQQEAAPESVAQEAVLIADRSCGNPEAEELELIQRYDFPCEGELTVELLAQGLTELSGLDFFVADASPVEDGIVIEWAADSTLIAGLDDREQKDEFHMYDVESLSWFMMDSLYATVKENLAVENVYYTVNGGEGLTLPEDVLVSELPADIPYMGSPFYYAHAGVQGEGDDIELDVADAVSIADAGAAMEHLSLILADTMAEMSANAQEGVTVALVAQGEEEIDGQLCYTFAIGANTPEKFTAEEHYAVAPDGGVYRLSIADNAYIPYEANQ